MAGARIVSLTNHPRVGAFTRGGDGSYFRRAVRGAGSNCWEVWWYCAQVNAGTLGEVDLVNGVGYVHQLPGGAGDARVRVLGGELEEDGSLDCDRCTRGSIDSGGNREYCLRFHSKMVEQLCWPNSELCPGIGDRGVVLVSAGHVPVVVESGEGDGELSISLSVQADVHGEGGTVLRLGLEPAFHIRVHVVRQGDGADNRAIGRARDGCHDGD